MSPLGAAGLTPSSKRLTEDVEGRKVSNSFLHNATLAMFERQGFTPTRQLGKNNWLVTKTVRASGRNAKDR